MALSIWSQLTDNVRQSNFLKKNWKLLSIGFNVFTIASIKYQSLIDMVNYFKAVQLNETHFGHFNIDMYIGKKIEEAGLIVLEISKVARSQRHYEIIQK